MTVTSFAITLCGRVANAML